jgi:capsular exopolysaccharide synthesis family protein
MSLSLLPAGIPRLQAAPPSSMADQLLMLRRHISLIITICLAFTVLAAIFAALSPPAYTASAILLYNPAQPANTPPASSQDEDAELASQAAIVTSLPALKQIAASLGPDVFSSHSWPFAQPVSLQDRINATRRALAVFIPANARLLEISFTGADPVAAAFAANLAVSLYLNHQRDQSFADLQAQQSWLQGQQTALQTDLDSTQSRLAAARGQAGQVAGMQGDLSAETASRITASLVDAQAALAMATARLHAATAGDAAAASAEVAPNLLPLRKEQADLAAQVKTLAGQYGADYPDLVSARASLTAIDAEISDEAGREIAAARAEVAADQAAVDTLSASLNAARLRSQNQDAQSAPQLVLSQHADTDRALLQAIAVQSGQLAQEAALTRPPASIISAATPPLAPDRAHRGMVIAAAAMFGLCLGVLLAGAKEALDTSFRTGKDLTDVTGLTCLALLPEVINPGEVALDQPFSLFAEQLRALRTAFSLNRDCCIFTVTAARPGEAKTTLTAAFGRALAAAGMKVLAIDADIRQPSFDIAFCTRHTLGLTDYLAGLTPLDEILQTDFRGPLNVMTAGTQTADALSLFLSPRFNQLLSALRGRFDVVLIDAPPAFALAETQILSRAADAILFCVRWGSTPRAVVQAAIAILAQVNARFAGAVLTRVDPVKHRRSGFADAEMYQPRFAGYFRQ